MCRLVLDSDLLVTVKFKYIHFIQFTNIPSIINGLYNLHNNKKKVYEIHTYFAHV